MTIKKRRTEEKTRKTKFKQTNNVFNSGIKLEADNRCTVRECGLVRLVEFLLQILL